MINNTIQKTNHNDLYIPGQEYTKQKPQGFGHADAPDTVPTLRCLADAVDRIAIQGRRTEF